jgi:hypothetical protein
MKTILILILTATLAAADTPALDSQREAVAKFPELGVEGSEFHRIFMAHVKAIRKANPSFFDDPRWPMLIAEDVANPDFWLAAEMKRAQRRLLMAPRQDQFAAAVAMREWAKRKRPLEPNEFMLLSQESKRVIQQYVPQLLPLILR